MLRKETEIKMEISDMREEINQFGVWRQDETVPSMQNIEFADMNGGQFNERVFSAPDPNENQKIAVQRESEKLSTKVKIKEECPASNFTEYDFYQMGVGGAVTDVTTNSKYLNPMEENIKNLLNPSNLDGQVQPQSLSVSRPQTSNLQEVLVFDGNQREIDDKLAVQKFLSLQRREENRYLLSETSQTQSTSPKLHNDTVSSVPVEEVEKRLISIGDTAKTYHANFTNSSSQSKTRRNSKLNLNSQTQEMEDCLTITDKQFDNVSKDSELITKIRSVDKSIAYIDNQKKTGKLSPKVAVKQKSPARGKKRKFEEAPLIIKMEEDDSPALLTNVTTTSQIKKPRVSIKKELDFETATPIVEQPIDALNNSGRKRGRKKKPVLARHSEITHQSEHANKESHFTCGNCEEVVQNADWREHIMHHNGLAWRVGIDVAINLSEDKALINSIIYYMKTYRQPTTKCERCGVIKKSAKGMVSHMKICGLTVEQIDASKVRCEHCSAKIMAVSLTTHLQSHCPVLRRKSAKENHLKLQQKVKKEKVVAVDTTGRLKRKAGKKAQSKIKAIVNDLQSLEDMIQIINKTTISAAVTIGWQAQFKKANIAKCVFSSCDFMSESEEALCQHHYNCPNALLEIFQCSMCKFRSEQRAHIEKHIRLKHMQVKCEKTSEASDSDCTFGSESGDSEGEYSCLEDDETEGIGKKPKVKKKALRKKSSKKNKMQMTAAAKKFSAREHFSDDCEVYRDMILDDILSHRPGKKNFDLYTIKWMEEFREKTYTNRFLFMNLLPEIDIKYMTYEATVDYIPSETISMRYMMRNTNLYDAPIKAQDYVDKWMQLEVFQSNLVCGDCIFYCGGPIIAMDWLPQPANEPLDTPQILALTCKTNFDENFLVTSKVVVKCLIQIWSLGVLQNTKLQCVESPNLLYSIACDYGPIWHIQFCPSGCYNSLNCDNVDRLGLLAVTTAHGDIFIYALRKSYDHKITNSYKIIYLKPSLVLTLNLSEISCNLEEVAAVKLCWTKEKEHNVLAAGFSNGVVAIWNITTQSSLLTGSKNAVKALLPTNRLVLAGTCVTSLAIHHTENSRYLMVTTSDRRIRFFDLKTNYQPYELSNTIIKSKVTCAAWSQHWSVIVFACDEAYALDRCAITLHQPRDIGLKMSPYFTFGSSATDLAANDWLSINAVTTDGGDVLCHMPTQFMHNIFKKNAASLKYILTYTKSIPIAEAGSALATMYDDYKMNHGILFSDTDRTRYMDIASLKVKQFRKTNFKEYPATKINKIAWNQNENSYHYYAVGYQTGFVRIKCFKV